jgi:hypothetical protein
VSGNFLDGALPEPVSAPALQFFRADDNSFSGSLPDISAMADLAVFSVERNQLSGEIPFAGTGYLRQFRVAGNHLTGAVPSASSILLASKSSLCPNAFDFSVIDVTQNDLRWDAAVGAGSEHWWGPPGGGCDGIFGSDFDESYLESAQP